MSLDRLITSTESASGWPAVPGAPGSVCARFDQLWEPDSRAVHKLAIEKFRERVNKKFDLKLEDYDDLYKWSIEELESFWGEVWSFTQPVVSKSYDKVLAAGGHHMDDIPKWFTGCELNFAENLLKFRDFRPALYSIVEGQKTPLVITFAQLYEQVRDVASALRRHGLKKGDRVAGYLPNSSDAVAIMLAVTSIGAVWSSASPDFGVSGVLSRFKQVEPRFLFSVEAVKYHGTVHDNLEKLREVTQQLSSVEKTIVVPFLSPSQEIDLSIVPNAVFMQDFINEAGSESRLTDGDVNGSSNEEQEIRFEQLPFDHPLYIMFSSGTTGKPKCIVHSVGGTLIQHLKEHQLHFNVSRDDVMLFYTTTGWMMWNWAISCLALGCPVVCYDGSPFSPSDDVVWDLVDSLGVTLLGVSPKMLTMMETKGVSPKKTHKLTSLRAIFSTGSPLAPKSFNYVYTDVKQDILLSSITGGTDIISLFGAGSVSLPVYRGQIQCRGLGMAVECFNEEGVPTRNEPGELVCTKPFPCMPIGFWNDKDGEKYRQAYFSVYPHVWAHGDFCMITTKPPGIVMMGRSDGTLNPSGVRFGSSDIYNIVETLPEVEDSLCVGQMNSDGEERVILFLKLTEGSQLSNELVCKVKGAIRFQLTPRHVPAVIMEAPDIPYTVNSKKVEVAVKKIISGHHLEEEATAGLANPEALNFFNHLPDLQQWLESPVPNGH